MDVYILMVTFAFISYTVALSTFQNIYSYTSTQPGQSICGAHDHHACIFKKFTVFLYDAQSDTVCTIKGSVPSS